MKNKKAAIGILVTALLLVIGILFSRRSMPSEAKAVERVQQFAQVVNYDYENPENIYPFLTEEIKNQMTEAEFVAAFELERSYPYLTPLFINYLSIEMDDDLKSGKAIFSQAARLPGMIYEVPFVYENGDYFMDSFREFADGSYLEKFEILAEQSDWVDSIFSKENSLK